jgi:CheY-like chemotaxis protein
VLEKRVRELESICADVLIAAVDLQLPQALHKRLWTALGGRQLPHAVDVSSSTPLPAATAALAGTTSSLAEAAAGASAAPPTQALPDVRLASAARNPRADPQPPAPELRRLSERKTVVVVDDDPIMLDVLGRILQRENFHLIMASSGPEALRKIEEHAGAVDLLVTDYAMPGMQGRELADRVRMRHPEVKVLYQTGFSDLLFENRPELEGGAAFLEKPFSARGLREAARLVLFSTINPG